MNSSPGYWRSTPPSATSSSGPTIWPIYWCLRVRGSGCAMTGVRDCSGSDHWVAPVTVMTTTSTMAIRCSVDRYFDYTVIKYIQDLSLATCPVWVPTARRLVVSNLTRVAVD